MSLASTLGLYVLTILCITGLLMAFGLGKLASVLLAFVGITLLFMKAVKGTGGN